MTSRLRSDLHQSHGIRGREIVLVECALLAHDRIDDAAIELGADRAEMRYADRGEGIGVHGKALRQPSLADEQQRAGVVVPFSNAGESIHRMRIRYPIHSRYETHDKAT